jgi:hypothetical protein
MAAAQFGVGGHGQVPLLAGGLLPFGPVFHNGGEHVLALAVGIVHVPVASGSSAIWYLHWLGTMLVCRLLHRRAGYVRFAPV